MHRTRFQADFPVYHKMQFEALPDVSTALIHFSPEEEQTYSHFSNLFLPHLTQPICHQL